MPGSDARERISAKARQEAPAAAGRLCTPANLLTGLRIPFAVTMLFFPALSPPFNVLYIAAGTTDMLDGAVARKTNTASEFGARLDSIADLVFVAASLFKLLPALDIPAWLFGWIAAIALIKAANIVFGYVMRHKYVMLHTALNKFTGALLFVLPLTLPAIELRYSGAVVCAAATLAAAQEGHYIRMGRES